MRSRLVRWSLAALVVGAPITAEAANEVTRRPSEAETVLRNASEAWTVGDRLRVTLAGMDGSTVGRFVDVRSDTLFLSIPDASRPLPVLANQLGTIEEAGGRKRHPKQGAIIGAVIGLAAGLIVNASDQNGTANGESEDFAAGAVIGGGFLGGFVVGGAVGFFITTDKWVVTTTF